ncbi:hypothetical protein TNCV_97711 [Trichonephila clavipes]|nr:hypothetical protein TNCV_97711 [Trichonephila clavipes]
MNLIANWRESPLEYAGISQSVEACRNVSLAPVKLIGFPFSCLFKDVAEICIRLLVLVTPHTVDFEAGDGYGNCTGNLSVGWINEGQRLTCPRTSASECPLSDDFPRETT